MKMMAFMVYYILEVIQVYVSLIGYSELSKINLKYKKTDYLLIFIFSFALLLNNMFMIIQLKTIVALFLLVILNRIIYKQNMKQTLIISSILFTIILLCELLISIIFLDKFKTSKELNSNYIIKSLISTLDSIILYIIFKLKKIKKFYEKIRVNVNSAIIFMILVLLLNGFIVLRLNKPDNLLIIVIIVTCIIFMISTIKVIINEKYNIELLKEKNKCIKDSYRAYYNTIQECSTFKHNLKNALYSFKVKLPSEYQKSFDNIVYKYMKDFEWINNIVDIPEGLQGVIYLKIKEAKKKKVNIILNSKEDLKISDKDYIDICEIVGILIDNAIYAANLSQNKTILVDISENKKNIEIKIANTFTNVINLDKITKKYYSTKKEKSGLGLNYISKIKSKRIKVKYEIINNIFISKVLYIINKKI